MERNWRPISRPESFDLIVYLASLFLLPRQEQSLTQTHRLLKDKGIVAANVPLGIREKNQGPLKTLNSNRGIIKNDEIIALFKRIFTNVSVTDVSIPLPLEVVRDIFQIPAQSAGIFPKLNYNERIKQIHDLVCELKEGNLQLINDWSFIIAGKD